MFSEEKIKELNKKLREYGYTLLEIRELNILEVVEIKHREFVGVRLDREFNRFTLSTVGSIWRYKDIARFKKEFDEMYQLMEELNSML